MYGLFIYQNKQNPNKYLEVKYYKCRHFYVKQFMQWNTPNGLVKNYLGSRSNKGTAHRYSKKSFIDLIENDYYIIEAGVQGQEK